MIDRYPGYRPTATSFTSHPLPPPFEQQHGCRAGCAAEADGHDSHADILRGCSLRTTELDVKWGTDIPCDYLLQNSVVAASTSHQVSSVSLHIGVSCRFTFDVVDSTYSALLVVQTWCHSGLVPHTYTAWHDLAENLAAPSAAHVAGRQIHRVGKRFAVHQHALQTWDLALEYMPPFVEWVTRP